MNFKKIIDSIDRFKNGEFLIVMDDDNRENEGDLILGAEFATSDKLNFMIQNTTGIICCPMTQKRANDLKLHTMTTNNTDINGTNFTVTCDVIKDVTTGVSSSDRSNTAKALANNLLDYKAFNRPGHIFPLVAEEGGVLKRRGHTEATIDLCKIANIVEVGIIGEIMNKDGTMSRYKECEKLAIENDISIITIEQLVEYKKHLINSNKIDNYIKHSSKVKLVSKCNLVINNKNDNMECELLLFWSSIDNLEHSILIHGDIENNESKLVRVHSECFTGNVFHSMQCDCHDQLEDALELIKKNKSGILIYHNGHEGRGIGLGNKIKAYELQNTLNLDTIQANEHLDLPVDNRNYDTANEILKYLNATKIDLITNNPIKIKYFENIINSTINVKTKSNIFNLKYLKTKKENMAHNIEFNENNKKISLFDFSKFKGIIPKINIAIIKTNWNQNIINSIENNYIKSLIDLGISIDNITCYLVPGAFELPFQAKLVSQNNKYLDVIICIGAIIKGDTPHFKYISNSVTSGLMNLQLNIDIPIIMGILTCNTYDQALERVNSAEGWAYSTIQMAINKINQKINKN